MQKLSKIDILLCSPYNGGIGGISRWTDHILAYYEQNKSDNLNLSHYYETIPGGNADYSLWKRSIIGVKNYSRIYRGLVKHLQVHNFDVVHFCSSASLSLLKDIILLKAAKNRGVKSVIHFRFGRIPDLYQKRNWECKLLNICIKLADKIVVIDQMSYDTLLKEGYNNIELLPNPLSPKVLEIIEQNKHIEKEERKIVFAGHCIQTKGIFELIEACREIDNIKLKMIGFVSEETRAMLLEKAGENSIIWLKIAGEQDYETTIKEMLSAGVFVLPTYTEGFPNVILESMACACPIVTTKVGSIPEMLDIANGENHGICIEPKNMEQLREAIQKMLNDRKYALKCGLNAQKRVNEIYSMPIVWNELQNIWKKLN
jgi:glycosyltransferase involved in cell wall biosynthesis